jgi:hypothetical protein
VAVLVAVVAENDQIRSRVVKRILVDVVNLELDRRRAVLTLEVGSRNRSRSDVSNP